MNATAIPGTTVPIGSQMGTSGAHGIRGMTGATGATGERGLQGFSSTTLTAEQPFTVPEPGQTVDAFVEDPSWITLGQMVYVEGAGGVNLAAAFQVKAINHQWLTLLNPLPSIVVPAAKPFRYVTQDTLLEPQDSGWYLIGTGGAWELTLPEPEIALSYRLRCDRGVITLKTISGRIDNEDTLALLPGQECDLFTDGFNWRSFGLHQAPIGSMLPYGGQTAPAGYLICDGRPVSRVRYVGLFQVLGTAFGAGDGTSTFNLPDCRSRSLTGIGPLNGTGVHNMTLGLRYGTDTETLTEAQMPSHLHSIDINHYHSVHVNAHGHGDPGHNHSQQADYNNFPHGTGNWGWMNWEQSGYWGATSWSGTGLHNAGNFGGGTSWVSEVSANWHLRNTDHRGSTQAHNNVSPSLGVNYIIKY